MKYQIGILLLSVSINSHAAEYSLLGKWKDKTDPSAHQYEFAENSDFIYTYTTKHSGKRNVSKGVWEAGAWSITNNKTGAKRSCRLTIYAATKECCFEYKFIASNLILTNEYSTEEYGVMCKSRVLIRATKK